MLEIVGLDFYPNVRPLLTDTPNCFGERFHSDIRHQVIVFHKHHVVEPEAMVLASASDDRRFLQSAKPWSGLSRIEDFRGMLTHRVDKLPGERGDSAQALEKIQRDPLRFKDRPGQAVNLDDRVAGIDFGTVVVNYLNARRAINPMKNFRGCVRSGDDRFFARHNFCRSHGAGVHKRFRGDIAFTNVLLQRDRNRIVNGITHAIRSAR